MLPWWGWVVLWVLLLATAGLVVGVRGRRVWRSLTALGRDVEQAGALVGELESAASRVREPDDDTRPAVTRDPRELRAAYREPRAATAADRSRRRAARRPPWARVD
jgi:hypothetical protein